MFVVSDLPGFALRGAKNERQGENMDFENIVIQTQNRVGVITFNRPRALNALNDSLMDELGAALRQFEMDDDIGAIVITGSEKAFAAGADIAAMADFSYMDAYRSNYIGRNWEHLKNCRKPVIAAVSGFALGGGCELAMMCDLIIAADTARFSQPEVKLGVLPGAGGTQRLPRAIGKAKAMDMCLTARMIDAEEAERSGLVARVVPADKVIEEAMSVATTIASYSLPVVMMIKESINRAFESGLNEGLLFERRVFHAAFALEDQKEGMKAFLEKRRPSFEQR
jgi:enoyl-CoA hydratase